MRNESGLTPSDGRASRAIVAKRFDVLNNPRVSLLRLFQLMTATLVSFLGQTFVGEAALRA